MPGHWSKRASVCGALTCTVTRSGTKSSACSPMRTPDLVSTFLRPLNRAGVSYMVTGSVAAAIYGEPRFTQDVDIVLSLSTRDAAVLADAFSPSDFYCAPVEVIAEEAARKSGWHFNIYH